MSKSVALCRIDIAFFGVAAFENTLDIQFAINFFGILNRSTDHGKNQSLCVDNWRKFMT